jgi:hypothetical protein
MVSFITVIIKIAIIMTQEANTQSIVAARQEEDLELIVNNVLIFQYTGIE